MTLRRYYNVYSWGDGYVMKCVSFSCPMYSADITYLLYCTYDRHLMSIPEKNVANTLLCFLSQFTILDFSNTE